MPLAPFVNGAGMTATQVTQLIDLLKGVMNDQPVTLKSNYSVTGDILRIDTVSASGKNGIGMLDAGTVKWEIIKDTDQGFKLWDSARGAYVMLFASNGDISLPSTAKLLGSADFRTAARLIAGADPGAGGAGDIVANRGGASPGTGVVYFGSSAGTHYVYYNGSVFQLTDDLDLTGHALTGASTGAFSGPVRSGASTDTTQQILLGEGGTGEGIGSKRTAGGNQFGIDFYTNGIVRARLASSRGGLDVSNDNSGTFAPTSMGHVPVKIAELGPATGSETSYTFSSIPQGFRHLLIYFLCRDTSIGTTLSWLPVTFNGDTAAHYFSQDFFAQNAANGAGASINQTSMNVCTIVNGGATALLAAVGEIHIPYYSSTTFYKSANAIIQNSWAAASMGVRAPGAFWNSTAAITSISFIPGAASFAAGSMFTLYGIP